MGFRRSRAALAGGTTASLVAAIIGGALVIGSILTLAVVPGGQRGTGSPQPALVLPETGPVTTAETKRRRPAPIRIAAAPARRAPVAVAAARRRAVAPRRPAASAPARRVAARPAPAAGPAPVRTSAPARSQPAPASSPASPAPVTPPQVPTPPSTPSSPQGATSAVANAVQPVSPPAASAIDQAGNALPPVPLPHLG